ncbi:mechanosensitive ion channel family protein [Pseudoduganella plicata]|uniref:Mechanosensitive ion channel n=1 Tax=Pseudoduganella plicata TaxID=321984 RepID=A0A4P7BDA0_9BURK|nr:mechanosensitive ion channel domain-containing protein [Pseudoduganella plicata]QBQ36524.1 mechanosensitive ion channel [Pseudoduganella plicata]GGY74659.1 mechanosensitive ion channel protein [Pseudoduganella plicata]
MNQQRLTNLFNDLLGDLQDPGIMWQLGAIAASILAGWGLSRLIHKWLRGDGSRTGVRQFGMESFGRVVGPLAIVCLLALSQVVLARWHHINLIKLALPIFGSLAVIRFGFYLLRRVFSRHGEVGAALLTFEKIFQLVVWIAVALYVLGYWDDIHRYLDHIEIRLGKNRMTLADILQAALSVIVTLVLAMWAGAALEERLMHVETLHSNLRVVMARVGRAVLIVVAVLFSLNMVGIDLTVLSVFGGALGVGLGFGLQKIASNYVSGFIILLDRSLAIGDMITVDKFSGRVARINTRYTVLQGLDGIESIVPNEMLVSGVVQNSSLTSKYVWIGTKVSVSYETDLDFVLKLLEEAAAAVPRVLSERPPSATLLNFGADGLELQLGFWIADPENGRGGVTSDVNRAIWKALKEHGISVPFPQREMRIVGPISTAGALPEVRPE